MKTVTTRKKITKVNMMTVLIVYVEYGSLKTKVI